MSASVQDYQLAALAAGFTLGFGFLTVWEAVKQTRRNRNPWKSVYIYMLWGEIVVNVMIGMIGWLFLHGVLGPSFTVLFFILVFWVFEIQLLMQIIINRIALIAEHRSTVRKIKWGTVVVITAINIAVFCIWIPAHLVPPVSPTFVMINNVWDKTSKVLILIVDAGLNWYFLRTVRIRLVQQHGLIKYKPLVGFNAKLMAVSVGMDATLIGLMFLRNQIVYIQIHPVVYMVKLNIEMSMASLVVRLAQGRPQNDMEPEGFRNSTDPSAQSRPGHYQQRVNPIQLAPQPNIREHSTELASTDSDESLGGIECRTDLNVVVENVDSAKAYRPESSSKNSKEAKPFAVFGDETAMNGNTMRVQEKSV